MIPGSWDWIWWVGRGLLFEWIWLTVSGFELVRVELVVLVR